MATIHPTAIVHPQAQLDETVTIGPFSIITEYVQIGAGTQIDSHVRIDGHTTIGKNCHIHHGAVIGTPPQDLKHKPGTVSFLKIGDQVTIREYATLNVATDEGDATTVGNQVLLMAYAHVAHDCVIGNNVIIANSVGLAGHVRIDDFAIIGGMTGVHQFVAIGAHAFVGGFSRISQDVLPYVRCAGSPLKMSGLNTVGLKRRGFSDEVLSTLKKAYRLIYRSDLNTTQAVERIQNELPPSPELNVLLDFITDSVERHRSPHAHGQGIAK
ncbi:MAG: acyl-ACP--UDP-N-acetylglucosamine O-acyltransferase [Gemmatimonadetes bacterium]|nr:MAG: acyl-ACP--UDP-N-acetylglucosamine O-acyltransferase [Gemmatimonadota bacterium]